MVSHGAHVHCCRYSSPVHDCSWLSRKIQLCLEKKRCILLEVKLYARRNAGKSQKTFWYNTFSRVKRHDSDSIKHSKRMDSEPHSSFTRFLNNLDEKTTLVPSIQQCKHFALFTYLQNKLFKVYCNITENLGFFPGFPSGLQKEWIWAPFKEWSFYFKFSSWNGIDYTVSE